MSRLSKGDRVVVTSRMMRPVWEHCCAEAALHGVSVSAYVADVMAMHANRPDLVKEIHHHGEALPLAL